MKSIKLQLRNKNKSKRILIIKSMILDNFINRLLQRNKN